MLNTKEKGILEFLFYKKPNKPYVGVCLTFDIIEEGNNLEKLKTSLFDAAIGHIMVVKKENLSNKLLNRPAPKKYWDMYYQVLKKAESERKSKILMESYRVPIPQVMACA